MRSRSALGKSLLSAKSLRTNINLPAGPQTKHKFYNRGRWFMAWWGARVILPVEGFLAFFQSSDDSRGTGERIHLERTQGVTITSSKEGKIKNTAPLLRHCPLCHAVFTLPLAHNLLALLSPARPNFSIKFAHPSAAPRPHSPHSVHDIPIFNFAPTLCTCWLELERYSLVPTTVDLFSITVYRNVILYHRNNENFTNACGPMGITWTTTES